MNRTPRQCSREMLLAAVGQILDGHGSEEINRAVLDEIMRRWTARRKPPAENPPNGAN